MIHKGIGIGPEIYIHMTIYSAKTLAYLFGVISITRQELSSLTWILRIVYQIRQLNK